MMRYDPRESEFLGEHLEYADHHAKSLLNQKSILELTPLQVVLQYFERQRVGENLAIALNSCPEILELLPQCDWSIVHPDGWVAMDPEGKFRSTITSPETLFQRYLEPLQRVIEETRQLSRNLVTDLDIEEILNTFPNDPARVAEIIAHGADREWVAQLCDAITELLDADQLQRQTT